MNSMLYKNLLYLKIKKDIMLSNKDVFILKLRKKMFYFSGSEGLEWKIRFKVAVGVAEGLQYLHHSCQRRIIHRDIKASNILLTQDYEAQVLLLFI